MAHGDALADFGEAGISQDRERLREMADSWLWMWHYRKPLFAQLLPLGRARADRHLRHRLRRGGHPVRPPGGPRPRHSAHHGHAADEDRGRRDQELLFTGDLVDAHTAKELWIIQHGVLAAELDQRVMELCQRIARSRSTC